MISNSTFSLRWHLSNKLSVILFYTFSVLTNGTRATPLLEGVDGGRTVGEQDHVVGEQPPSSGFTSHSQQASYILCPNLRSWNKVY
jgi:hypothetical protein